MTLQAHSTIDKSDAAFVERDATIYHDGKAFASGGAWLLERKDNGKLAGILYNLGNGELGTWDGSIKVKAHFGRVFSTNFGTRAQYAWFTWQGRKMIGRNGSIDWQDIFRVHEVKA
jgi:hypothetical protein